jgi:hypothetical protein
MVDEDTDDEVVDEEESGAEDGDVGEDEVCQI